MTTDAENIGQFWAALAVEELVRSGVTRFCISPGSRSTPLAVAVSRNPGAESTVHFDERGAAFFALGYARCRGTAAAVITTSGTAVANCLPAVVEASTDGVPMVLLTADRPPEARGTGANQTIHQVEIFGAYTRWFFDLPVPTEDIDPTFVLTTLDQAVHRASEKRGPVHVNCMFREPLEPVPTAGFELPVNVALGRWMDASTPFTEYDTATRTLSGNQHRGVLAAITRSKNGVIIAGRLASGRDADAVAELADRLKWPVLADVLSNVRSVARTPVIRHVDLLLKSKHFRDSFRPDCVLHLGSRTTSKILYKHLEEHPADELILVAPNRDRIDPKHRVTVRVESDVSDFCTGLLNEIGQDVGNEAGERNESWLDLAERVEELIDTRIDSKKEITEPGVARAVTRFLPDGHDLFVAASMPIRDVDMFGFTRASGRYAANRGASGIDGTVASAVGYAAGSGRRLTLLIGDLALLHDLNSLSLIRQSQVPITIVAVNNNGGGVFSFLPISDFTSGFEQYFGTPHGLSFEHAAGMFGLDYLNPGSQAELVSSLEAVGKSGQSVLIEVNTNRVENKDFHLRLYAEVNELVGNLKGVRDHQ